MSHTAYSQYFARELDFKQLLQRRGVTASLEQIGYGLSSDERDWMRRDLLCPSCRCGGASLVRSDVAKGSGRNTRQAHFRFIDASGHTAHKVGCDFYSMDDAPGVQKGVDVVFTANDKDTKIVRELVCKAISVGELSKTAIFEMRSWFLAQRDANTFEVKGAPDMIDWLWSVHRQLVYEAVKFEPIHLTLPGFNERRAALRDLAFQYRDFRKSIPRVRFGAADRDRTKHIIAANLGQRLISMEPMRPKFETATRLAGLMADYGKLRFSKKLSVGGIFGDTPDALLAFSASLLFVSDWDEVAALARFAKIATASLPEDMTLGNVIGLNPFHDFAALEMARFAAGLPPETERPYDLEAELTATLAKIDAARGSPPCPSR